MIGMKRVAPVAVVAAAALALAACSSSGGKESSSSDASSAGSADTPRMTIAMITHQAPGDTFWDIIRKGAEAASAKGNVELQYSNDPDAAKQAQLIQTAIDKKVDGIAVTDPNTPALKAVIEKAVAAGIPVSMFNAGGPDALELGAIGYFGQGRRMPASRPVRRPSRRAARTSCASSRPRASSNWWTGATVSPRALRAPRSPGST